MKCLTICNPYPNLIMLPKSDPRHKRVENREWPTNYRGTLLIHAGKSRQWLTGNNDGIPESEMVFGGIVAVAELVECAHIDRVEAGVFDARFPWLKDHRHANGTWCWVLANVRKIQTPIPYRGAQGIFDVIDPGILMAAREALPVDSASTPDGAKEEGR